MEEYIKQQNLEKDKDYELSHIIGLNSTNTKCVQAHPMMIETILYSVGGIVIAEDLNERNNQVFFRHGNNQISCFRISNTGRYIAVGFITPNLEKKMPSSIIIWDYETKSVMYELTGIYKGITLLEFSQDDKFLSAAGLDNTFFIWEVESGYKCFSRIFEFPTSLILWTTITYENKHPNYTITLTNVNAINYYYFYYELKTMQYSMKTGKFTLPSTGYTRTYTSAVYDEKINMLYVGTSGGELTMYNVDNLYFKSSFNVINNGVACMILLSDSSILIGGGDGRVKRLIIENNKHILTHEIQLNGKITSLYLTADKKEAVCSTANGYIFRVLVDDLTYSLHSVSHNNSVNDCAYINTRENDKCYTVDDNVYSIYLYRVMFAYGT